LTTNFLTIPFGTTFSGQVNNQTYTFSTIQDYTVNSANGTYTATIAVYEGDPVTQTYTVPTPCQGSAAEACHRPWGYSYNKGAEVGCSQTAHAIEPLRPKTAPSGRISDTIPAP